MNKLTLAFSKFPREGHSPTDAALMFRSKSLLDVRGNVYERLSGALSEEKRNNYISAVNIVSEASKKSKGDVACILKELRKL